MDLETAEKYVMLAWILVMLWSGLAWLGVGFEALGVVQTGLPWWVWGIAPLSSLLAYGIAQRSRLCAAIALAWTLISAIIRWTRAEGALAFACSIPIYAFLFVVYFQTVRATIEIHRQERKRALSDKVAEVYE